jgi:hypothetical protein
MSQIYCPGPEPRRRNHHRQNHQPIGSWLRPMGPTMGYCSGQGAVRDAEECWINVLILWGSVVENGFLVQSWVTFRQALGLGGNVRKGERGTPFRFDLAQVRGVLAGRFCGIGQPRGQSGIAA